MLQLIEALLNKLNTAFEAAGVIYFPIGSFEDAVILADHCFSMSK